MFLKDIYKNKNFVVSFELFPPKKDDAVEKLYTTVEDIREINPDYISVTYGAGGSTQEKTFDIVSNIKKRYNIETVSHLTCVNATKETIGTFLTRLKEQNIENILALRGDPPEGQDNFSKTIGGFEYASELTEYIHSHGQWSIAVAGYPEGHQDSQTLEEDVSFLKVKVDKGADVILTQLFYDNNDFYTFMDLCTKKGIEIPIVPGIFPILTYKSIKKITSLCGSKIPKQLDSQIEKHQNDQKAVEQIGIEYAVKQCEELLQYGVKGIHFYTMNKSHHIKQIYRAIESKITR